jgi:pimeloyl-ACP methyl ester carboxylesterase
MKIKSVSLRVSLLALFLAVSMMYNTTCLAVPGNVFLPVASAQGAITETVKRRNLVIDLGDGLKTDAQLTLPIIGDGPFPGVLLIHGSGNSDMDEYLPPIASGTNEPTRLFLQIAEYLSNRGFAVLRYNKRGVGLNGTILDMNAWRNLTIQDLVQDAETALKVLEQQPEVDSSNISLIGHSEGTMIAPIIAVKDPTIRNIVLMGAIAQNLHEVVYFQIVDRPVKYAEDTLDTDHDGLLSTQEVEASLNYKNVNLSPLPPLALIQNYTGEWGWYPGLDTSEDGYFDIENELKPIEIAFFDLYTSSDPKSLYYSIWLQSDFALKDTNLDIIGNVSASILILQGEGDTQALVEQAFLLEQRLTEVEHVDHTLITYPGLGHTFYPADGWLQPLGPMQDGVLADLFAWLESPVRTVRNLEAQIQADAIIIEGLQIQLTDQTQQLEVARNETRFVQTQLTNDLNTSNALINDLQSSLSTYVLLTYIALIIAAIAIIGAILTLRKRMISEPKKIG